MRIDNPEFSFNNKAQARTPVFVVRISFDTANTDVHYITSAPVNGLTGNIINNSLKFVSSTSQSLNPDKALSTIGSIKFQCLDDGLTQLQRQKLQAGDGLKDKLVQFYMGDLDLTWDKYALVNTQTISTSVSYKDQVYTFQCADVQRQLRKNIFDVKETALTASLSEDADVIEVFFTSGFDMVKQPASESGITDAPGQKVGYLIHEVDGKKEIIRYTGKTSNSFTGCTRGVLGTKPIASQYSDGDSVDEAPKITEFVYLEMAAPKLTYALMTGSIYGEPGEFLPDHWHLGISTDYVKTSDFVNIGVDLWNLAVNDAGLPAVVKGVQKVDGKQFIEEQLLLMMGAFMPVYSTGELGLRLMGNIAPNGGYDRLITDDQVASYGELKHDLKSTINQIQVSWNYVIGKDDYTRQNFLVDPDSIAKHGKSTVLELKMRTLETSRHSYTAIKSRFDSIRDSYAGPPILLNLQLTPDQNDIEAGDFLRVNLQHIQDFTKDGAALNRNFQVRRAAANWETGGVDVSLFASSQPASAVAPQESTAAVADAFYASEGTEINATNFPGAVSSSGGVTTIGSDISLAGADSVNDSAAVYYCLEDMTINAAAVVTITKNVQIRVRGFLQNNGTIDGSAKGMPGGLGVSTLGDNSHTQNIGWQAYDYLSEWAPENIGERGFIDGTCSPQTGGMVANRQFFHERTRYIHEGARPSAPVLNIEFDGSAIKGLPDNLQGTSGAGGGCLSQLDSWSGGTMARTLVQAGSDGGDSGAALVVLCRGFDHGANAKVDTSGGAADIPVSGQDSNYSNAANVAAFAGAGVGGQPGAVYYLMDGQTSTPGTLDESNSVAFSGESPIQGDYTTAQYRSSDKGYQTVWPSGSSNPVATSIYTAYPESENLSVSAHRVQFVTGYQAPENDISEYVETAPTFTLTEQTNTPVTPTGNRSTIEVSVTPPPGDENYSYSEVDYKRSDKTVWISADPASNESLIEVPSAGATFDVRVRPVSKSGLASPSGEIKQITAVDRNGRTDAQLAAVYPFSPITDLAVEGGGSTFTGLDAGVWWSNENAELAYFGYYRIEVYSGATLLRTEQSVSPNYVYSYEKNRADYFAQNATVGAYLDIDFDVRAVSKYRNNLNELYAGSVVSLAVTATSANDPQNLRFYTHADVNDERINNNNATPYTLINMNGNTEFNGSKVAQTALTGSWTASVYSVEGYTGGAFVSCVIDSDRFMIGLNSDPSASLSFTSIDYAIYPREIDGLVHVYESGGNITAMDRPAFTIGDTLGVFYNNVNIIYFHNGIEIHRSLAPPNLKLYLDSSFDKIGAGFSGLQFGPLTAATDYTDDRINNNNATPYTLVSIGAMTVNGSKVSCTSGVDWVNSVWSQESYTGGAFVSFKITANDKRFMLGLNSDPLTDDGYLSLDYSIYIATVGEFQVRHNGSNVDTGGTPCAVGDVFTVFYDNVSVRFYHNGALVWTIAAAANLTLFLDSSFRDTGAGVEALNFGPYTSNNWDDVGGANRPADNATEGATWGGDIVAQPTDSRLLGNLFDLSEWEPNPSVALTGWTVAGTAPNELIYEAGPELNGHTVLAFHAWNDGGSDAIALTSDGIPIEADGTYRVSFFAKGAATLAKTRLKVEGDLIELDDTAIPTPPTYQIGFDDLDEDWYLLVGVVRRHNTVVTVNSNYSGIYNVQTGERVKAVDDVKFEPTATTLALKMEADIIDAGDHVYFYRPRIELMDGTEPSVAALIGTPERRYVAQDIAPIMFGVASAGTKITSNGSNITTTRPSTGDYRLNHTGGYSGYPVVITPRSGSVDRIDISESAGYVRVRFYDTAGAAINSAFSAMVDYRYNA